MLAEDIVTGFRSLSTIDFDPLNSNANGSERLYQLTDAVRHSPDPERFIPEMFAVMERLPEADLGSPGPLVHTLERLKGYEEELFRSIRRKPTELSIWMINRIMNTAQPLEERRAYTALLREAAAHPEANESARDDARRYLVLQEGRETDSV